MPSLKSAISAALFCLAIVFSAASANADTTYTYTGQQLTDVERLGCLPTPCLPVVNFTSSRSRLKGLQDTSAEEETLAAAPGGDHTISPPRWVRCVCECRWSD
jgi:hypothetical protein